MVSINALFVSLDVAQKHVLMVEQSDLRILGQPLAGHMDRGLKVRGMLPTQKLRDLGIFCSRRDDPTAYRNG